MLIKAPSRNRLVPMNEVISGGVYPCPSGQAGIAGALFEYLFGQAKRYKTNFLQEYLVLSEISILQHVLL